MTLNEKIKLIIESEVYLSIALDFEPARFHDWEYTNYDDDRARDEREFEAGMKRLEVIFDQVFDTLNAGFGKTGILKYPDERLPQWALGAPRYSEWFIEEDVLCMFIWMDNREDPPVLILGKTNKLNKGMEEDPWEWTWMPEDAWN